MLSKKLWSSARGEGGGSWQRGLPLALMAGEALWSWRSIDFVLHGACATCTLGQGQAWQCCPPRPQ